MKRRDPVRKRRRAVFAAGVTAMLLSAALAVALGTGCIFDEGTYQGGGRRTGAPTSDTTTQAPTSTSTATSTSTSTSTPDAGGSQQLDSGGAG